MQKVPGRRVFTPLICPPLSGSDLTDVGRNRYKYCCSLTGVQLKRAVREMLGDVPSHRMRNTVTARKRLVATLDNLTRQQQPGLTTKERQAIVQRVVARHVRDGVQEQRMRTTLNAAKTFFSSSGMQNRRALESMPQLPEQLRPVIKRLQEETAWWAGPPAPSSPSWSGGVVYTCVKQCAIRASADLQSNFLGHLQPGEDIVVSETKLTSSRELRIRFDRGWVSFRDGQGGQLLVKNSSAPQRSLLSAAKQGDVQSLGRLIQIFGDTGELVRELQRTDEQGNTAVMEAASCNKGSKKSDAWITITAQCVKILLRAGANAWATNHNKETAMCKLIRNGPDSADAAGLLLSAASPDDVKRLVEKEPQGQSASAPSCLQLAAGGRTPNVYSMIDRCIRAPVVKDMILDGYREQINSSTASDVDILPIGTRYSSEDEAGEEERFIDEFTVVPGGPMGSKLNQHFFSLFENYLFC